MYQNRTVTYRFSSSQVRHQVDFTIFSHHNCVFQPLPPVTSYTLETIGPLASTKDGVYLAGGTHSGNIHLWEVCNSLPFSYFTFSKAILYFTLVSVCIYIYVCIYAREYALMYIHLLKNFKFSFPYFLLSLIYLQVGSGELLKLWSGHHKPVKCVLFSWDDSFLITGSSDGMICVWSMIR